MNILSTNPTMISTWLENLIPMASGLIGAIIGGIISYKINLINKNENREIRSQEREREIENVKRHIYGKIFSLNTIIIHNLQLEAYHTLNQQCYQVFYNIEKDETSKRILYEGYKNEYEKQVESTVKLRENTREYSDYIGQYNYLNPKSNVMLLYYKFYESLKKHDLKLNLDQVKNKEEAENLRQKKYDELMKAYEGEISTLLSDILIHISNDK